MIFQIELKEIYLINADIRVIASTPWSMSIRRARCDTAGPVADHRVKVLELRYSSISYRIHSVERALRWRCYRHTRNAGSVGAWVVGRTVHPWRCPVRGAGGSLPCGRYSLALLSGNEEWSKELRHTLTQFPIDIHYASVDSMRCQHIWLVMSVGGLLAYSP